jgi:hypothetical protein
MLYNNEYIVEKDSLGNYVKININKYENTSISSHFTENTLYGIATLKFVNKTNESCCLYNYCDIIWFDFILINPKDINKLQYIEFRIGGCCIWKISIKLLLKVCKPTIFNAKLKISFPKNLFIDDTNFLLENPLGLDDFIGIPNYSLRYHESRFTILSESIIDYELYCKSTYLNKTLHEQILDTKFNIKINQIKKLMNTPSNYIINNNNNEYHLDISPELLLNYHYNADIESNKIINSVKNYNNKIRRDFVINLTILPNVLINIISEYDNNSNTYFLNIANNNNNYIFLPAYLYIKNGIGSREVESKLYNLFSYLDMDLNLYDMNS